jgi:hypothetical protein
MRRPRGRSILQIEGIERLETRITPTAPLNASLVGFIASNAATIAGGLGQFIGGEVGGSNAYGQSTADTAKIHLL